ncbi:hypothetical protein CTX90_004521 [Salmonella enterica subsp. diarizonae]|nr:hypothetical protein [Salmonella enterica subsp. diarizonae]
MTMRLSVRWKKDRRLQFRLALFTGGRSDTYKDVVNASDGCTTEERLVTFTKLIIDDRIYPQRFISFIFPIFSSFAQGHFLDINYMNTLINDVEKTEPVGVIPTMANEVSN